MANTESSNLNLHQTRLKIIFLLEDPVPNTTKPAFRQQYYLDKYGFRAELWDVRFICGKKFEENKMILPVGNGVKILTFRTKDQFLSNLKKQKNVVFFSNHKLTFRNLYIYRYLKKHNIQYIIKKNKSHLLTDINGSIRFNKKKFRHWFNRIIYERFNAFFFRNYPFINEPLITLLGTEINIRTHNFPIRKTKTVFAHNHEYEKTFFQEKKTLSENIILFIDQYLPYHPEVISERIDAKKYYNSISKFLIKLSVFTGLPAVIAAHPRSDIENIKPYIEEQIKIEYLNTTNLIKDSKFVVGHISAAVIQVLALRKNYLLITNNSLIGTFINKGIYKLSEILNLKVHNIDEAFDLNNILSTSVSTEKNELFQVYIKKKNTPEQSEWDILFSKLAEYI